MDKKQLYQKIPSVSRILQNSEIKEICLSGKVKTDTIRLKLEEVRKKTLQGIPFSLEQIIEETIDLLKNKQINSMQRIINATGIILHTGLGRAPIPPTILQDISETLKGYVNLEVDSDSGKRSQRDEHLREIVTTLTGAEDCTIVNNNAAAVLITISAIAKNKEVIVSAGQLVEIGGSFRIPEIIEESGAKLRIVGCTNKTHLKDYEKAITENTAAILHVHTSNYKVEGFTHSPTIKELKSLALHHNLPLIDDAGSGALIDLSKWNLHGEPLIQDSISMGADIVTFSGDKILGACQSGIIVGKKELIKKIRKNPLFRVLRPDKFTLFILERTLRLYLDPESVITKNPTLRMLTENVDDIKQQAEKICCAIQENSSCNVTVEHFLSYTGSGALPTVGIPSYAVVLRTKKPSLSISTIAQRLRNNKPVVFTVAKNDALFISPRTLLQGESEELISILKKIL